jgi:hypothetical protein
VILILTAVLAFPACRGKDLPAEGQESGTGTISEVWTSAPESAPEGTLISVRPNCPPSCGVSLTLPDGWTYETVQEADDPTSCVTVSIRPEDAEGEGAISVSYRKGFGVCGTGLVQKDVLFNGHEATMGFYDGSSLWSFICLKDPEDCVIINSAERWYAEYEEEIGRILSTVSFVRYDEAVTAEKYEGYLIASASLDIDGDGLKEECVLTDGPTSGLFTVIFKASRDGNVLYCNTFNLSGCSVLSLEEKAGTPYLVLQRYFCGEEPKTEYHRVSVEGKRIVIDALGEFEGYWGDENWNFDRR